METLIVICLVIVIILLLYDKIIIRKPDKEKEPERLPKKQHADIMGVPKPMERLAVPTKAIKSQIEKPAKEVANFETETEEKDLGLVVPQEELDEVFGQMPDLDEEDEDWRRYGETNGEDGFATGVTFEELSTVGMLLQHGVLEPSQQKEAVDIVHRIQGTELFSLLESSIENAAQKIARLLDKSINQGTDSGSSTMRNKGFGDFDIGEFV